MIWRLLALVVAVGLGLVGLVFLLTEYVLWGAGREGLATLLSLPFLAGAWCLTASAFRPVVEPAEKPVESVPPVVAVSDWSEESEAAQ